MSKLNPNAQMWVDALRSGQYSQTKHTLRSGDRFCCLGVLCEVAIANGLDAIYDFDEIAPPKEVADWVGLYSDVGSLEAAVPDDPDSKVYESLAAANDDGCTFEEIAKLIETYAEVLGVDA